MAKKIATVAAAPVANVLTYRRDHPKDRVSYGVPGVAGIVVFDKSIFANGKAPKSIVVNCELAAPAPVEKVKPVEKAATATA